jgi:hypothetical protein
VLAREDYDSLLFNGATLHDLPDRPALYINAFDVANHVRFVLSKHYVDATYSLPRGSANKLNEPRTLFTANDLAWTMVVPASVRVADVDYAANLPERCPL